MTQENRPSNTTVHEGIEIPAQRQGHPGHHPNTVGMHGMLLTGTDPVYASHLPMFMPPHNYQVLLKLGLEPDVPGRIHDLRAHFGRDALITMAPRPFAISDLSPADPSQPAVTEFCANAVRGHSSTAVTSSARTRRCGWTRSCTSPSSPSMGGRDSAERPGVPHLRGRRAQLYLAHRVRSAPDFDQVLIVNISGAHFTERELDRQGRPTLTVPRRADSPEHRLQAGDRLAAHASAGQHFHTDVEVEVVQEMYSMVDELT